MSTKRNANTAEEKARMRRYWLADNPGVITRVAREFGVTQSFVSRVFNQAPGYLSEGRRVERRLAELGAPGFHSEAA